MLIDTDKLTTYLEGIETHDLRPTALIIYKYGGGYVGEINHCDIPVVKRTFYSFDELAKLIEPPQPESLDAYKSRIAAKIEELLAEIRKAVP